jgi:hypothetical protein
MPGGRRTWAVRSRTLLAGALLGCAVATAGIAAAAAEAADPALRSRAPVPAGLSALESSAEDLVDDALAHDRTRVVATAGTLAANSGGSTAAALRKAGVPPADITALRAAAARVSRLSHAGGYTAVALAANAVSSLVTDFYAHFSDPVPVAVRRLDYLDREAQLRSLAGQSKAVQPVVVRLAATWAPLRPAVVAHGGATVAAAYGRHVAAMRQLAGTPRSAFRREAVNGLNIVDELEAVFTR